MSQLIEDFVQYCQQHIRGDGKGEAQIFLDRLFTAFGHPDGRYEGVDYFNGGLFALNEHQISQLQFAAKRNWRRVNPSIFGSTFEAGLEKGERHVLGAHYTHEIDIKKVVAPVIPTSQATASGSGRHRR